MSIEAICWVFQQDVRPSSVKFVLLALADCCGGDDGLVWPSIPAIAAKTSQDRKTVIEGISTLEAMGFLRDTGKRTGATKQVKVYRMVGLPSSEHHYTYLLTDPSTSEFYFGIRSCACAPAQDAYMGSGRWPQSTPGLTKLVLGEFSTREEAAADEIRRIRKEAENPLCMNILGKQSRKRNSPGFDGEESRFSRETVPFPGHGTMREPEQGTMIPPTPKGSGGNGASSIESKMDLADGFTGFWEAYPRKVKKDKALSAWKRKRCAGIKEEIMLALAMQRTSPQWLKKAGQFIPHPTTWINGGEWQNEGHAVEQPQAKEKRGF